MRNSLRTIFFISAFSPALITMAYVRYDIYGLKTDVWQLLIIGFLGTLIPILIMYILKSQSESFPIQVKKIESNDFMLLVFIASYLSPIVTKSLYISINTIITILLMIGIILCLTNYLPSHPILRFMSYKFYKIESDSGVVYTLISKRNILHPKEIKSVKKISDTMLFEDNINV